MQKCTLFIDVYKAGDNFFTSGAMLLSDLDLQETYRAIDSVATGRVPSLSCAKDLLLIRHSWDTIDSPSLFKLLHPATLHSK